MDNKPYFVAPYPERGEGCYKLEVRRKFAGKKIRRFFSGPGAMIEAYDEGERIVAQIQEKGVSSLDHQRGMLVPTAVARFWGLKEKVSKKKGRSKAHMSHLKRVLTLFSAKYARRDINSIKAIDLVEFWDRKEWPDGFSTRWQAFTYLRLFFNLLEKYDVIPSNPIRKVDPPSRPDALSHVVTPEQMRELMKCPDPHFKAFICNTGFAGLRPSEALRVDPETDYNWKGREIRVVGSDDSGNRLEGGPGERFVKMEPAFVRNCPKTWRKLNQRNFYAGLKKYAATTSMQDFPQNVFRHSWFTYHLARWKNAAVTAHEGGNSEDMVKKVYAKPAQKANQRAYWAI